MPKPFRFLFSLFSRYADGFVYASERSKAYYSHLVKSEVPNFVVPAPVDTKHFSPKKVSQSDNKSYKREPNEIIIGTIANINPVKGLEDVIRVSKALEARNLTPTFVIVGKIFPSQEKYFKRLTKMCSSLSVENVVFAGSAGYKVNFKFF